MNFFKYDFISFLNFLKFFNIMKDNLRYSDVDDFRIRRFLSSKENIEILEDMIEKESDRLIRLRKSKFDSRSLPGDEFSEIKDYITVNVNKILDINNEDTYCEWEYLTKWQLFVRDQLRKIAAIRRDVVSYLAGFDNSNLCIFDYFIPYGEYNQNTKKITITTGPRAKMIPCLAHEYTHHTQNIVIGYFLNISSYEDGQARIVERNIAADFREKEDNESFLYQMTKCTLAELRSTYHWICDHFNVKPKKAKIKTLRDRIENAYRKTDIYGYPSPHSSGNSFFRILEAKDKKIFLNVLQGKDFNYKNGGTETFKS